MKAKLYMLTIISFLFTSYGWAEELPCTTNQIESISNSTNTISELQISDHFQKFYKGTYYYSKNIASANLPVWIGINRIATGSMILPTMTGVSLVRRGISIGESFEFYEKLENFPWHDKILAGSLFSGIMTIYIPLDMAVSESIICGYGSYLTTKELMCGSAEIISLGTWQPENLELEFFDKDTYENFNDLFLQGMAATSFR